MKRLTLFATCVLLISACKKSESTNASVSINGKWTQTKTVLSDSKGNVLETTNFNDPKDYLQFNSDGTGITSNNQSGSQETSNFTYSFSNKTLIVVESNERDTTTVKTLTSQSLVLSEEFSTGNSGGEQIADTYFTK